MRGNKNGQIQTDCKILQNVCKNVNDITFALSKWSTNETKWSSLIYYKFGDLTEKTTNNWITCQGDFSGNLFGSQALCPKLEKC